MAAVPEQLETAPLIQAFLEGDGHLSVATQGRRYSTLWAFYHWTMRQELVAVNPMDRLDPIVQPKREPRPLPPEEVAKIMKAIPAANLRDRTIFMLLYETGVRVGEILALQWSDVTLAQDDEKIRIFAKGQRERTIMLRALTLLWLFGGLRSHEIVRLRTGCVRMQTIIPEGKTQVDAKTVCLLDIPVHKTGHAFTKPVDALVGEAILAWEKVRPEQPQMIDAKTGEVAHFLFCYRAHRLRKEYLNLCLIPALCQKAGVPRTDACGSISSHRARSTIASQLFNAREPMTLFELQAWLGHQSPATTQHYVATSPTKLIQAYNDAGYFARNTPAIEVLIDQQAIVQGQAAQGIPWRYYNLGHGWCCYEFFDQCPHCMACARCDFYVPKDSASGQWLEARDDLLKMLQEIPLSDDERAAVDGDVQALKRLLELLGAVLTSQ